MVKKVSKDAVPLPKKLVLAASLVVLVASLVVEVLSVSHHLVQVALEVASILLMPMISLNTSLLRLEAVVVVAVLLVIWAVWEEWMAVCLVASPLALVVAVCLVLVVHDAASDSNSSNLLSKLKSLLLSNVLSLFLLKIFIRV
jgi:hypothetical protein